MDVVWNEESFRVGFGWILMQDEIIFSLVIIVENVFLLLMVEGLVFWEVLQKSRELGIKVLNVELDFKNFIVSVINNKLVFEFYGIVVDIMLIFCFFDYVFFKWIFREVNYVVDLVVKQMFVVNGVLMIFI